MPLLLGDMMRVNFLDTKSLLAICLLANHSTDELQARPRHTTKRSPRSRHDDSQARYQASLYNYRSLFSLGCPYHEDVVREQRDLARAQHVKSQLSKNLLEDIFTDHMRQWCTKQSRGKSLNHYADCVQRLEKVARPFSSTALDKNIPANAGLDILAQATAGMSVRCLLSETDARSPAGESRAGQAKTSSPAEAGAAADLYLSLVLDNLGCGPRFGQGLRDQNKYLEQAKAARVSTASLKRKAQHAVFKRFKSYGKKYQATAYAFADLMELLAEGTALDSEEVISDAQRLESVAQASGVECRDGSRPTPVKEKTPVAAVLPKVLAKPKQAERPPVQEMALPPLPEIGPMEEPIVDVGVLPPLPDLPPLADLPPLPDFATEAPLEMKPTPKTKVVKKAAQQAPAKHPAAPVERKAASLPPAPPAPRRELSVSTYGHIDPQHLIAPKALKMALEKYDELKRTGQLANAKQLTVVDYSIHADKKRLFIIDMESGKVAPYLTAHGRGSDKNDDGYADAFSNSPGSYQSSLGFFLTTKKGYYGPKGYSLDLIGLESRNSLALKREIIVHGAKYVDPKHVGRSLGCLSLEKCQVEKVIDRIQSGSLLLTYHAAHM